jgi:hypothetical protein
LYSSAKFKVFAGVSVKGDHPQQRASWPYDWLSSTPIREKDAGIKRAIARLPHPIKGWIKHRAPSAFNLFRHLAFVEVRLLDLGITLNNDNFSTVLPNSMDLAEEDRQNIL